MFHMQLRFCVVSQFFIGFIKIYDLFCVLGKVAKSKENEINMTKKMQEMDMLHGSIWNKMVVFALPLGLTSMLQQLYNAADVFFLGHFVGGEDMAAVGNSISVIFLIVMLFVGMSIGANVVMARYLGQGKRGEASATMYTGIWVALLTGLTIMFIGLLCSDLIVEAMGVPKEVREPADIYLCWYFLAMPFISLFNFEAAFFRSKGDTATPLWALCLSCSFNVVGNYLAVGVFNTGINGVACATLLSYVLSSLYLWGRLMRESDFLKLQLRKLTSIDMRKARAIISIGLPAGVQGMVFGIANLIFQVAINSLGADAMAGSAAGFTIENNLYCFVNAFGLAATTFIGQCYGAGDMQRCRRVFIVSFGWCTGLALIVGVGGYFISPWLLTFFTDSQIVADIAMLRVLYVMGFQFLNAMIEALSDSMRGYGWSMPPAIIAMFCICGERLWWLYAIYPSKPDYETLMVTYPISWALTAVVELLAYIYCLRKFSSLLKKQK